MAGFSFEEIVATLKAIEEGALCGNEKQTALERLGGDLNRAMVLVRYYNNNG